MTETRQIALTRLPAIELDTVDGGLWRFPSPDGDARWLVVIAYRGEWCPFCCIQLADYGFQFAEFATEGAMIVGISSETPAQAADLRERLFLPFELLPDPDGAWSKKVGIWSAAEGCPFPTTIVADREGNVRFSLVGGHPSDRPMASEIFTFLGRT